MLAKFFHNVWEIVKFVGIILLIVVPIRTYIAQPFIVSGASMEPTFTDNEYLIVDELSYHLRPPARGEVVIFRYPKAPSKYFIKRIIGLPGEKVTIKDEQVLVTTVEKKIIQLNEPYARGEPGQNLEITLGPGEYFVLGDNRQVSLDSRAWGPLDEKFISGRAAVRLFPFDRLNLLPGAATY
jgi:signal peptidase I